MGKKKLCLDILWAKIPLETSEMLERISGLTQRIKLE